METWRLPKDETIVEMIKYEPHGQLPRVLVATTLGVYEIVGDEMRPLKFVIPDKTGD